MHPALRKPTAAALGLVAGATGAVEISGFAASEIRYFPDAPRCAEQFRGTQLALILTPEFRWLAENGDRYTLIPHALVDSRDPERT